MPILLSPIPQEAHAAKVLYIDVLRVTNEKNVASRKDCLKVNHAGYFDLKTAVVRRPRILSKNVIGAKINIRMCLRLCEQIARLMHLLRRWRM